MILRYLRWLALILLLLVGGLVIWRWDRVQERHTVVESSVLLEQYLNVLKLITNEGKFQEIYSYKDYWGYDIAPLRKKALIRATGRVLVGYDLEEAEITLREEDRMVILEKLPKADILAMEVDIDYYDLDAGTFNPFRSEDLNKIEKDVKQRMREKALQSDLFRRADEQVHLFYLTLKEMARQAGWEIRYRDKLTLRELPS
jgi:hypothetical protein